MGGMPRLGFPLLASATALVAWALVAVGGVVRITESGLGCPDWPLCHGGLPPDRKQPLIESSHRGVAALVTVLALATAVWAWRRYRARPDVLWPAIAAAGFALVSLGAAVVATHAEEACGTDWPGCNGGFARGGSLAGVQVAHRSLAYLVAVLAVSLLVLAWRGAAPRVAGAVP